MAALSQTTQQQSEPFDNLEGKYLIFNLGYEEYGIAILKIKEIISMLPITPVPQTPQYVKGVINLRGKVIPVADLRLRFGMVAIEYTAQTCIIVVEIDGQAGKVHMGIVVDSVREVLNIKATEIESSPTFGVNVGTQFILGMAKKEDGVKILLEIGRVLGAEQVILNDETP
jgi:purine-binding chemotaxis protein CheW